MLIPFFVPPHASRVAGLYRDALILLDTVRPRCAMLPRTIATVVPHEIGGLRRPGGAIVALPPPPNKNDIGQQLDIASAGTRAVLDPAAAEKLQ